MDTNTQPELAPERLGGTTPPVAAAPSMPESMLRLLALLSLLGASTVLYILAGMAAMSAVATTGGALFAAWEAGPTSAGQERMGLLRRCRASRATLDHVCEGHTPE